MFSLQQQMASEINPCFCQERKEKLILIFQTSFWQSIDQVVIIQEKEKCKVFNIVFCR